MNNLIFEIKNLTFCYPEREDAAIKDLNLDIAAGEFLLLCGPSGCGKSTLLRQFKSDLAPHGKTAGQVLFEGRLLSEVDRRTQSSRIGFVQQSPDNQIVTDKVWHELAFGLESLGYSTPDIRRKVAEMASFFGIQNWFYKDVTELSGGQKQLLNLASVMTMQPSVLILDEPTSQLDPIAASEFLGVLGKINRELGTTIILTEHRLEEAFPLASRVAVMEKGRLVCQGAPEEVGRLLLESGNSMFLSMPAAMRIWAAADGCGSCPVTVREGRDWLTAYAENHEIKEVRPEEKFEYSGEAAMELEDVWFKYDKDLPDVVKGVSLKVRRGEFFAILGGNGTGKSTTLKMAAGLERPYRGKIRTSAKTAMLPQNPQVLFVKKTVREDLMEVFRGSGVSAADAELAAGRVIKLCRLEELLDRHPYDLSGGEQQRAALAKVLLTGPEILLLDEPTKGFDAEFKQVFAEILKVLLIGNISIIMVTHDIEFCAENAHRCALFFDGNVVAEGSPREFFGSNHFYTTAANRIARTVIPGAVTTGDVIEACGGKLPPGPDLPDGDFSLPKPGGSAKKTAESSGMSRPAIESACSKENCSSAQIQQNRKLSKRTAAVAAMILLLIPFTLFVGEYYLSGRKYYFISLLILLECMAPFFMIFESRKPQARELVTIATLCAIGVAGRAAFFMLPEFKPVMALVIISGVAMGGETGFLVGSMTMLASNVIFSQGPWTPWQMFAMGIIGFFAGICFRKGLIARNKRSLCVFGALCAIIIYGGIMNPAAALMWMGRLDKKILLAYYASGFPVDCVHAAATVLFLWLGADPMLEKLDRIKTKYGLAE